MILNVRSVVDASRSAASRTKKRGSASYGACAGDGAPICRYPDVCRIWSQTLVRSCTRAETEKLANALAAHGNIIGLGSPRKADAAACALLCLCRTALETSGFLVRPGRGWARCLAPADRLCSVVSRKGRSVVLSNKAGCAPEALLSTIARSHRHPWRESEKLRRSMSTVSLSLASRRIVICQVSA